MHEERRLFFTLIAIFTLTFIIGLSVGCSGNEEKLAFISKRGYLSEAGVPAVVGEVKNAGNANMTNIQITASFYCSSGKLIGEKDETPATISAHTEIEILAPGETSPFKVTLSAEQLAALDSFDVEKFESYKVTGDCDTTNQDLYRSLEITHSSGELNSGTGEYELTGQVKNIGNQTAEQVKVIGTFYEDNARMIEVVHTYIRGTLLAGDESQFRITVPDRVISKKIKTYNIRAIAP